MEEPKFIALRSIIGSLLEEVRTVEQQSSYHQIVADIQTSQPESPPTSPSPPQSYPHLSKLPVELKDYLTRNLSHGVWSDLPGISLELKADLENQEGSMTLELLQLMARSSQIIRHVKDFVDLSLSGVECLFSKKFNEERDEHASLVQRLTSRLKESEKLNSKLSKDLEVGLDTKLVKENDKLKLKVISLEKQSEFLKKKCQDLESSSAAGSKKVVKRKKKKKTTVNTNANTSTNNNAEQDSQQQAQSLKRAKTETESEHNDASEAENEIVEEDEKENRGQNEPSSCLMSFDTAGFGAPKKKKKVVKKKIVKKTVSTLDNVLSGMCPLLLRTQSFEEGKNKLYYFNNYKSYLVNFVEALPCLQSKKEILTTRTKMVKLLFSIALRLIKSEDQVYFDAVQEMVERPVVLPIHFTTKSAYWSKYIKVGEKGINTFKRVGPSMKAAPQNFKFLLQEGVTNQIQVVLIAISNAVLVEIDSLKAKLKEGQNFPYDTEYPKDKLMRGQLKDVRTLISKLKDFVQVRILSIYLLISICGVSKDEETYFRSEISNLISEEAWTNLESSRSDLLTWHSQIEQIAVKDSTSPSGEEAEMVQEVAEEGQQQEGC